MEALHVYKIVLQQPENIDAPPSILGEFAESLRYYHFSSRINIFHPGQPAYRQIARRIDKDLQEETATILSNGMHTLRAKTDDLFEPTISLSIQDENIDIIYANPGQNPEESEEIEPLREGEELCLGYWEDNTYIVDTVIIPLRRSTKLLQP